MWWVIGGFLVWFVVGLLFAVVVGRGIRLADERSQGPLAGLTASDVAVAAPPRARRHPMATAGRRRRAVPLPPVAVAMAALALTLELIGYVIRLTATTGPTARLLSMDAPFSLPRIFVAGIFAVAAFAAVAGAALNEGRRTWWLTVGLVAGAISAVKVGSSLHSDGLRWLTALVGSWVAILITALMAGSVVVLLWVLARGERRDRRRVLAALSLYGFAVVGLSTVSRWATATYGWSSEVAAAATFVEESGEALAGVAYLVAVLVGVAPRAVLPEAWVLRRADDDKTLQPSDALDGLWPSRTRPGR